MVAARCEILMICERRYLIFKYFHCPVLPEFMYSKFKIPAMNQDRSPGWGLRYICNNLIKVV